MQVTVNGSIAVCNHGGGLVSKGNSALGKVFRLGAMLNPYDPFIKFCFCSFNRK
jgi:hypothetical protein